MKYVKEFYDYDDDPVDIQINEFLTEHNAELVDVRYQVKPHDIMDRKSISISYALLIYIIK